VLASRRYRLAAGRGRGIALELPAPERRSPSGSVLLTADEQDHLGRLGRTVVTAAVRRR